MAVGPKTKALIETYKQDIENKRENINQINETKKGYDVKDSDGNTLVKIENLDIVIDSYTPATQGLDTEVLRINTEIQTIQAQIRGVYTDATTAGCTDISEEVVVFQDDVRRYNWSFSGDNPFTESNSIMTSDHIGLGTYTGITTTALETFNKLRTTGFGDDEVTPCSGYGTSITALESQLATLRAQRNPIQQAVNNLKADRAEYELQRYGYDNAISQLNTEIAEKEQAITDLENADYTSFYLE